MSEGALTASDANAPLSDSHAVRDGRILGDLGDVPQALARHLVLVLGTLAVPILAVRKGVDTYYDFLNIKWAMGWLLSNGEFGLKGIASTRKWGPPFLDIWNSGWSTLGVWWIPPLVHGLVHMLLVPSVFLLARRVAPSAPRVVQQAVAVLSSLVPLVLMQVGTSTGHIYATLPLVWSLSVLVRARRGDLAERGSGSFGVFAGSANLRGYRSDVWRQYFLAGSLLALSPLLKPSALSMIPAHLVGVVLLTGAISGSIAFVAGFASVYLGVAVSWSVTVALVAEGTLAAVQSPGVPLTGFHLVVVGFAAVIIGLCWWAVPATRLRLREALDRSPVMVVSLMVSAVLVSLWFTEYLRSIPDFRWLVPNLGALRNRVFHAGDLQFGFQTVDLESAYFDTSIPLAMLLLGAAVLLLPLLISHEGMQQFGWRVGLTLFVCYPFLYNMWATGYTRYASQVVPLVGVAGLGILGLLDRRAVRIGAFAVLLATLALPHLYVDRASAEVPRFGQIAYDAPIYDEFVSDNELTMLNQLIPRDSTVLAIGTLNTYLIPQLGREDLEWWFWKPKRHEVATMSGNIIVMFSPGDSDRLPEYAEQGLLYDDCSVLRFRRTSVGLCIGSVNPAVRSEALGNS